MSREPRVHMVQDMNRLSVFVECGAWSGSNSSTQWKHVTCKNCLRCRKAKPEGGRP